MPERVLATLADVDPDQLRTLARLLVMAGGTVALFATAVDAYADTLEDPELEGRLADLALRRALRLAARDAEFVARLEQAEEPFWRAVYESIRGGETVASRRSAIVSAGRSDALGAVEPRRNGRR